MVLYKLEIRFSFCPGHGTFKMLKSVVNALVKWLGKYAGNFTFLALSTLLLICVWHLAVSLFEVWP